MTLNQLTYFCMLAKTQSYTQAAQALFIAQPSLSYAISTLEKELGCLLVAREGRRISLTPAGETFYRYAKAALEAIAQGVQAVQCGGVIRLGAIATAMAERIPKLVVDFRAEHPADDDQRERRCFQRHSKSNRVRPAGCGALLLHAGVRHAAF